MSEGHVTVFRLGPIHEHPNADSLSITQALGGYPVILRTGDYSPGDLAVYIPVDSIVPDSPEWAFLDGRRRIRAKKLRGVFSMGMLAKAPDGSAEGDDVGGAMGITRYDDSEEARAYRAAKTPGVDDDPATPALFAPVYDLEGLRRYASAFEPGEEVIATEKIHGENARYVHDGDRLWVGSRTRWKRLDSPTAWALYAAQAGLADKLAAHPGKVVYGELYGNTELKYDATGTRKLRVFDVFDAKAGTWLDHDDATAFVDALGLVRVPEIYRGPWTTDILTLAEGRSTLGQHVREGFVIRPTKERSSRGLSRVVLKMIGEGYLTRKEG